MLDCIFRTKGLAMWKLKEARGSTSRFGEWSGREARRGTSEVRSDRYRNVHSSCYDVGRPRADRRNGNGVREGARDSNWRLHAPGRQRIKNAARVSRCEIAASMAAESEAKSPENKRAKLTFPGGGHTGSQCAWTRGSEVGGIARKSNRFCVAGRRDASDTAAFISDLPSPGTAICIPCARRIAGFERIAGNPVGRKSLPCSHACDMSLEAGLIGVRASVRMTLSASSSTRKLAAWSLTDAVPLQHATQKAKMRIKRLSQNHPSRDFVSRSHALPL